MNKEHPISFAEVVKCDKMPTKKVIPNIIIKPKNVNNKDIERIVKKQILGDITVSVQRISTNKTGDVITKCKNKEDVERTIQQLNDKMKDNYHVEMQSFKFPRLKIFDVQNNMSLIELEDDIKNRNSSC
ncbi:hypothetical protein EVAR_43614_1 [Eumeta japonica]|uniref:Uncharacterized protein n=1 Tax=Eumeta variegata TaxID=151549 RepID=A0A4C1XCV7_EUMVA|nr:hypothetical protein EVAR_43614_1 [Eumeta japonica]